MHKTVKTLIPAFDVNMGGILLKQALPTNNVNQVDPFLLLHHAKFTYRNDSPAIHQGIGPHPHRGFSPVTFVIDGEVHHRDGRGHDQIAKKGEVQWMHAGAGIIHSERPSEAIVQREGRQEIIQLWINSPAAKKMQEPNYQYFSDNEIAFFQSDDKQIKNKLIAGSYSGLESRVKSESELLILWSEANAGGSEVLTVSKEYNSMLYLISGELRITGYGKVDKETLIIFDNDSDTIEITAESEAQFLVLSGKPINEKVVQQGPFVMNSETEIMEAMRDYQMGKMGILVEE